MKKRLRTALASGLLCAALTACGTSGDHMAPVAGSGGGDDRGARGLPNLFISPSGKPFRVERDQPYPVAVWFAAANSAHDGRLTPAEFRADAAAFFQQLDTNHDGVIDGFEVQTYEKTIAPEINPQIEGLRFGEGMDLALGKPNTSGRGVDFGRGQDPDRAEAGDQRPEGAGLFGLLDEPEPVAATDINFDGHITLAAFLSVADRRFAALDKKHVGYLTLESLPKTPVQKALERLARRRPKPAKQP